MEIKVGDYDVHKEGTIIGNENEPIDFIFNKTTGFIIRISFIQDTKNKETRVDAETFDKKGGHLKFTNFNNSLGIGNTAPLKIGTLNYRELLLNYRVYSIDNLAKTFHYTWLLGKEVKNGK